MQKLIFQSFQKQGKQIIQRSLNNANVPMFSMAAVNQQKDNNSQQQRGGKTQKLNKADEFLLKKLREKKEKYAVTKDNYRIDVGLIIERLPIFAQFSKEELENLRLRRQIQNKYKKKVEIGKDLLEFNEKHPTLEFERHDTENLITHQNDETKEIYHKNSKLFQNTDLNINDPKSIQYASNYSVYLLVKQKPNQTQQQNNKNINNNSNIDNTQWQFPSHAMYERQSLAESLKELTDYVQNDVFTTHPAFLTPLNCIQREFYPEEQEIQANMVRGIKGVKCFYYQALHMQGNIPAALQDRYIDFAWVPRRQLQNYLSEESYNQFVHVLTE